jgi:hypothetical protein
MISQTIKWLLDLLSRACGDFKLNALLFELYNLLSFLKDAEVQLPDFSFFI